MIILRVTLVRMNALNTFTKVDLMGVSKYRVLEKRRLVALLFVCE